MELRLELLTPYFMCPIYLISFYGFGIACLKIAEVTSKNKGCSSSPLPLLSIGLAGYLLCAGVLVTLHSATFIVLIILLFTSCMAGALALFEKGRGLRLFTLTGYSAPKRLFLFLILTVLIAMVVFESGLLLETSLICTESINPSSLIMLEISFNMILFWK